MTEITRERVEHRQLPLPRLDPTTPLPDDLPVAGGWGYSKEDACIITDDRDWAEEGEAIGLDFEFALIERRLIEELNGMPLDAELADIRWKVQTQSIERGPDGAPSYDCLTVLVTAFLKDDLETLAKGGADAADEGARDTWRALRFMNQCEYWFDVSRVEGIPDDAEFYMRIQHGRIHAAHEEGD